MVFWITDQPTVDAPALRNFSLALDRIPFVREINELEMLHKGPGFYIPPPRKTGRSNFNNYYTLFSPFTTPSDIPSVTEPSSLPLISSHNTPFLSKKNKKQVKKKVGSAARPNCWNLLCPRWHRKPPTDLWWSPSMQRSVTCCCLLDFLRTLKKLRLRRVRGWSILCRWKR